MSQLHVYLPGLFSALADWTDYELELDAPFLTQLLGRAQLQEQGATIQERKIAQLLGVQKPDNYSFAAALFAADVPTKRVLRAEPLCLNAGADSISAQFLPTDALDEASAKALCEEINQFFAEEPWRFAVNHQGQWFLLADKDLSLQTHFPSEILGQNIHPFLPYGEKALLWHRYLNELQMLLHQSALNQQREAQGLVPVNSFWLWGEGEHCEQRPREKRIISNDRFVIELAQSLGAETVDLQPEALQQTASEQILIDRHFYALWRSDDAYAWQNYLQQFDQFFGKAFVDLLKSRTVKSILIEDETGKSFVATSGTQRKFWQRINSLRDI